MEDNMRRSHSHFSRVLEGENRENDLRKYLKR